MDGDTERDLYFDDEQQAREAKAAMRARAAAPAAPAPAPAGEAGSPAWYVEILAGLSAQVCAAPADRDLQAALRAVSQAATASRGFHDIAAAEDALATLEEEVRGRRATANHGTKMVPTDGEPLSLRPEDSVH